MRAMSLTAVIQVNFLINFSFNFKHSAHLYSLVVLASSKSKKNLII